VKHGPGYVVLGMFVLGTLFFLPLNAAAADAEGPAPDKALCAKMIQTGKQAYQAGRFLDAKEYFRKAVQADPSSTAAWEHYDLSVINALGEKVNKNSGLIAPGGSGEAPAKGIEAPPPPPQAPAPAKKPKFVIEDDEGC
jgi:tetratricopeptide (TPR) repeat protein